MGKLLTPLMGALRDDDVSADEVLKLVNQAKESGQIDERDSKGRSALYHAVKSEHTKDRVLLEILRAGANPDLGAKPRQIPKLDKSSRSCSPIMLALFRADINRAERLWSFRSKPDSIEFWTEDLPPPVDLKGRDLAVWNHSDVLEILACLGRFVSIQFLRNKFGAKYLADQLKPEIPTICHPFCTALMTGNLNMAQMMLNSMRAYGVKVQQRVVPIDNSTINCNYLHLLIVNESFSSVVWVGENLDLDLFIDELDMTGCTPLMLATISENDDCIRYLIGKGADVRLKALIKKISSKPRTAYEFAKRMALSLHSSTLRALNPKYRGDVSFDHSQSLQ